jgi:hypothetical protein
MDIKELKAAEGKYGLLVWDIPKLRKYVHGVIKYVDVEEGVMLFKIKSISVKKIHASSVVSFQEKEMLPEVVEYNNKDVVWNGGILCHPENLINRKEIDLKR